MSDRAHPIGGPILTGPVKLFAALFGVGFLLIIYRLFFGLGATTAMNDGYPWGLWIAFDVVTGTALACGGYALAILVYVMNKGQYHPLVRPALLTSALGYTIAALSVGLDVGRWWAVWHVPVYVWHWNLDSALLEVALCIMSYVVVLWIELSPAVFEKWAASPNQTLRKTSWALLPLLEKSSIWIIAIGLLLPTMHQSSLGTLMLLSGWRLHPLWRTPMLPLLFLISCISMGYAVVVFESAFSSVAFKRKPDLSMLAGLARPMIYTLLAVVVLRVGDLVVRGQIAQLAAFDLRTLMFWVESALMVAPAFILASDASRRDLGALVRASLAMIFAGALYRFDTYLVAFNPGAHWSYFPSVTEILITVGLVSAEVVAYVAIVKTFPIIAGQLPTAAERQAV